MQVAVIPDHRAAVVTEMLWFKVGASDDPPGLGGMAHFFEHMMFRGTKANPGEAFSRTIARNGGDDNAFTSHDYTCFYEQIAKDRLKIAMALEADRMANLDLSDQGIATEREVVLEERRLRVEDDPEAAMEEQMESALHLTHPYGRPVIGWPDEVRRIGRVEAQAFFDSHYAPNNAFLVVAGDVTPDEVRSDAAESYGKLPARALGARLEFAEPPRLGETRMMILSEDAKVPYFSRLYRVVSYGDGTPGEAESLDVLAELLGGGPSSMLYRALVVERKLATDVGAEYDGMARDAAEFNVYGRPRAGVSLLNVEQATDQVLARLAHAGPKPDELARAKTQLVASAIYRRDSQYELASAYGEALVIGLTADDVEEWPARIARVTPASVKSAAQMLTKREAVTGYLVPHADRGRAL